MQWIGRKMRDLLFIVGLLAAVIMFVAMALGSVVGTVAVGALSWFLCRLSDRADQ